MRTTAEQESDEAPGVKIVDIRMPFASMVVLMVEWALAAIPALLILVLVRMMAAGFLAGLIGSVR